MTGKLDLKTSWGLFSPNYPGISHILDSGSMADLPLFVGRRNPSSVVLPNSAFDYIQSGNDRNRRATVNAIAPDLQAAFGNRLARPDESDILDMDRSGLFLYD